MRDDDEPSDPTAEFQKRVVEADGKGDKFTYINNYYADSGEGSSNSEVVKELKAIDGRILELRKEVGRVQKKQETQVNRMLEELEASRAEIEDLKDKLTHQEDVNRSILEELRDIRKEMAEMKTNSKSETRKRKPATDVHNLNVQKSIVEDYRRMGAGAAAAEQSLLPLQKSLSGKMTKFVNIAAIISSTRALP